MNAHLHELMQGIGDIPNVTVISFDPGITERHPTWVDLQSPRRGVTVEFRPNKSIGLHLAQEQPGFGACPLETYEAPQNAIQRLRELFA